MSATVLTKEQVKDIKRTWPEHTFVFRLADSHEALRAECEAVRADRDSLWTTVNKVKAERDAALAEVARNREAMDACVAYSQHWQCFEACRSIGRQEFERRSMEVQP